MRRELLRRGMSSATESLLEQGKKLLPRDASQSLEVFQKARVACHAAQDRAGEAEAVLGLARACKAQGKIDAFVSHLREYVAMVGPDGMTDATKAYVSYELGYSYFSAGEYMPAVTYLQAARLAARLAGATHLEAWALAYLGVLYARRGEPEKGVQMLQRGVNVMHAADDSSGERRLLLMTASMQHELHQLDDAIASYSVATTLARAANDIRGEGKIYRLVGSLLLDKGDHQSAMHSLKVAVQLASQSSDDMGLIWSSLLLGNAIAQVSPFSAESVPYWKQALRTCKTLKVGDPKKLLPMQSQTLYRLIAYYEGLKLYSVALSFRTELMELMQKANLPQGYATALHDVADVQARLGMMAEAAASYRQVAPLWHAQPDSRVNEGAARAGLAAVLHQQGLVHEAKSEALLAARLLDVLSASGAGSGAKGFRKQPSSLARARAMASVGDILARTGEVDKGKALAMQALQMCAASELEAACLARLTLARCLVESKDFDEARKLATEGLSNAVSAQLLPQVYQGLELQADICIGLENWEGALKYFEKMVRVASDKAGMVAWRGAALQRMADLHEKTGEWSSAEKLHIQAVSLLSGQTGRSMHSMLALVRLYEKSGNKEAAASFSRMLKHVAKEKD